MSDHLSERMLSAVVDAELSGEELARANDHLATCLKCSSRCLSMGLMKREVATVGRRYDLPRDFERQMRRVAAEPRTGQVGWPRWAAVAAVIAVCVGLAIGWSASRGKTNQAALVGEVTDQHIATLAGTGPPEVISSDRHTVKPWFQGKLPFSFNLPASLPPDTTLDGANLTYLQGKPVAQLLFSIGKHKVSVFVEQAPGSAAIPKTERAGFNVSGFRTSELEMIAVSDVDPRRLDDLVTVLRAAQ
ncbi:MAG TPA: zf-HC2 domain-containing protein [Acidobacteriaceae bacterium]|nr:zf-HC2 domain-containing protein [Acidobacteriaceae bacterium]